MSLRKLVRLCVHDQVEPHPVGRTGRFLCPGGEFLPEDALVIEKENGEWPQALKVTWLPVRKEESGVRVWYCVDGQYAEAEENDTCQVHIAGGDACGWRRVVPEGALVIEKIDGKYIVRPIPWPQWATPIMSLLDILASHDALADQVGEPG